MRVLLLGCTGRVGARLLPALLAHGHNVTVYMRNGHRLAATGRLQREVTVVEGCATDAGAIKDTILRHECNAVVNTAGRASILGTNDDFTNIFAAVTKAALQAQHERKSGPRLRCWLLSGWPILDNPKTGLPLLSYLRTHSTHQINYDLIRKISSVELAWSLFCASNMLPRSVNVNLSPQLGIAAQNLEIAAEQPPQWSESLFDLPLVGPHLNVVSQVQSYFSPLEDCMDFIADDLNAGLDSPWIGCRVGVKAKEDWQAGPLSWMNYIPVSESMTWRSGIWGDVRQ